jgi:hypothetical protein
MRMGGGPIADFFGTSVAVLLGGCSDPRYLISARDVRV